MIQTMLSDFPSGGSLSSNPISPVGGSPSSFPNKDLSLDQQFISKVLQSGVRGKNFTRKIFLMCAHLPASATDFSSDDKATILELAGKCRSTSYIKEVFNTGDFTTFIAENKNIVKIAKLTPKQRKERKRRARNIWAKTKRETDLSFKLTQTLRRRLLKALKWTAKSKTTLSFLGCSVEQLKVYLEALWQPGMSWDNYGLKGWHIDHIRPCASFNLADPREQEACFHYSNLQPLWAKDNIVKGARYNPYAIKWHRPDGSALCICDTLET